MFRLRPSVASAWPIAAAAGGFDTQPLAPTGLINPLLDYDLGPCVASIDGSGVPTIMPPLIKRGLSMKVPRGDAHGNDAVAANAVKRGFLLPADAAALAAAAAGSSVLR